jgi:hypothetical protein
MKKGEWREKTTSKPVSLSKRKRDVSIVGVKKFPKVGEILGFRLHSGKKRG